MIAADRKHYAMKLLANFPDEPEYYRFYSSDLIIPRFVHQATAQARRELRNCRDEGIDVCMEELTFLEQHISPLRRYETVSQHLLITAIIPLYNGAAFIEEAISSVLGQTLMPDEIIVVDDGSTDAGPDIVAGMARSQPIKLIRQDNGGQSSARNTGVDHAHGHLIAFLDQDDVWYPNHLAELIKPFLQKRHRTLGWSYSDLNEINEAGEMIASGAIGQANFIHPKRDLASCLRQDMFILPSASLISRSVFLKVGGFDERLSGYEDDDLFLRMFQTGCDNTFVTEPLSVWRIYQTSSSYSPRMAVSRLTYARILIERFPDDQDMSRFYVRDLIAPRFFRLMATEVCKATMKGTKEQRKVALTNLAFIAGYLSFIRRFSVRLLLLPALRIRPIARVIVQHRSVFISIMRRVRL
jgi:glycosyltransferase involved in cell wall biosynthesis